MSKISRLLWRPRRKNQSYVKFVVSLLHFWLGLLSSLLIMLLCLSGAMYAFKTQIQNLVDREILTNVSDVPVEASLDSLLISFENEFGRAGFLEIPSDVDASILISSQGRAGLGVSAHYDQRSGQLLGTKSHQTQEVFEWILEFHRFLLAGDIGKLINGIAGLTLLVMLFSGVIMWVPKKIKQLKKSLTIKWKATSSRLNYDLHKVLGFYSAIVLFFIASTGLYVSFHWFKNMVIVGLGGDSIVISDSNTALKQQLSASFLDAFQSLEDNAVEISQAQVDLDTILVIAEANLLGIGNLKILLPDENVGFYRVTKVNDQNQFSFQTIDQITISKTGRVMKTEMFRDLSLSEQFKRIAKPLHTGEIMGLPSIILYFIISVIGCSLPVTGVIIWLKKSF